MTDFPPSPYEPPPSPIDYTSLPVPEKRGANVVAAWFVIWLIVILIAVVLPILGGRKRLASAPSTTQPSVPTTPAPVPGPAPNSEAELKIASRLAIGFHELTRSDAQASQMMPMFVNQLTATPKTPHERLCAAVVIGDVDGADAAIRQIDQIQSQLKGDDAETATALRKLYGKGSRSLDSKENELIRTNLGWYGDLALVHDAPPDDPQRQALVHPAVRSIVVFSVAAIVVGIALLAGTVLLIIALIRILSGKLVRRFTIVATRNAPFLEAFAIYLFLFAAGALLIALFAPGDPLQWEIGLIILLPVAYFWPRWRGVGHDETIRTLGWHTGNGVLREMASGVLAYITGLPIIFVGLMILLVLVMISHAQPSHPIQQEAVSGPWQIAKLYFLASVWAPIFEESMFRGAFFGYMRSRWSWLPSAALVALIFALIHPQGWTTVPALFAIAIVLAGIREWRGSLIGCVTAHALHNGVLMTIFILGVA
jgi:membrane protease YdiL (CAAX protease family)